MTANEMADLLILFDSGRVYKHSHEIAAMLRQQQAEIEILKECVREWVDDGHGKQVPDEYFVELLKKAQQE